MLIEWKIAMTIGSKEHFSYAVNIALEAVKSLLLVNGGAATALIALTNKGESSVDYSMPVLSFGAAAILNCIVMVIGYFSQLYYANSVAAYEMNNTELAKSHHKIHGIFQWIAIAVLVLSLIFSIIGMSRAIVIT